MTRGDDDVDGGDSQPRIALAQLELLQDDMHNIDKLEAEAVLRVRFCSSGLPGLT